MTILGYVLTAIPRAQRAVVNSALKEIPIIGAIVKDHALKGGGLGLAIGLFGALSSGLVTMAAQSAFNTCHTSSSLAF